MRTDGPPENGPRRQSRRTFLSTSAATAAAVTVPLTGGPALANEAGTQVSTGLQRTATPGQAHQMGESRLKTMRSVGEALDVDRLPVASIGGRTAIVTIVVYHSISSQAAVNLDLDYYQEWNYTTVTPDQVADFIDGRNDLPYKPLLITFDDGYASQYLNAYPGLRDRGMTATFYVTTGWLDGTVSREQVGFSESTPLTWAQCREMFAAGMRIQTHTTNHIIQTALSATEVAADFAAAQARVQSQVPGERVTHMAYPYGAWNTTVKEGLTSAGCRTARVVRVNPRNGSYPGPNEGRLAYALAGLHDRLELPCAGSNYGHLMQANFNRNLAPDEEMVPDYGFEAGGKGWDLGIGFSVTTSDKYSGRRSLTCRQGTATVVSRTARFLPVGPYCRVVGMARIKTVGLPPSTLTKLQYQIFRPDGFTLYRTIDAVTVTGNNNGWTAYSWSYTGDINAGFLHVYCLLQGSTAAGASLPSGAAFWDEISVRRDVLPSPLALPY